MLICTSDLPSHCLDRTPSNQRRQPHFALFATTHTNHTNHTIHAAPQLCLSSTRSSAACGHATSLLAIARTASRAPGHGCAHFRQRPSTLGNTRPRAKTSAVPALIPRYLSSPADAPRAQGYLSQKRLIFHLSPPAPPTWTGPATSSKSSQTQRLACEATNPSLTSKRTLMICELLRFEHPSLTSKRKSRCRLEEKPLLTPSHAEMAHASEVPHSLVPVPAPRRSIVGTPRC
jgi:hypothetical protein